MISEEDLVREELEYIQNECSITSENPHEYRAIISPMGRTLLKYCIFCEDVKSLDISKVRKS